MCTFVSIIIAPVHISDGVECVHLCQYIVAPVLIYVDIIVFIIQHNLLETSHIFFFEASKYIDF